MRNGLWVALAVVAAWGAVATAQVTTGTISGTVTDPSGAVLPNVKMEMTNSGTGAVRTAETGANGHYSIQLLPVGNYKITGSLEGFQTEVRSGIELTVGREAIVDMRLQVGAVSERVEVTGEAPLVQTTEATVSYLVADQTMRDLPLNGRDMSQLILLNPGVTETETTGGQAFAGFGRRISISGARGEDNIYLLDGGLIGDFRRHIPAGPSGALLGIESVQEFQVLTNAFSAQYGRSLGGVFNSVSKSGTNGYHGDAYEYIRNDKLDARKWEDNAFPGANGAARPKPPFRRNQFGATLGGPVAKDKIFFFTAYEGTRERLASTVSQIVFDDNARKGIFPPGQGGNVPVVSPLMVPYINWYPLATPGAKNHDDGTQDFNWAYSQPTTEDFGQGRVDLPGLTSKDAFFVRFTDSASTQDARSGFPGFLQVSSLSAKLLTLSDTRIYSAAFLNTLRFHFSRVIPKDDGREPPPPPGVSITPGQPDSPMITPGSSTVNSIGGGGFATKPIIMTSNRFTYQDDANWTLGGHSLQFGGLVERFQLNSSKPNRASGVWAWSTLQHFLAGTCNNLGSLTPVPPQCAASANPTAATTTEASYRGAPPGAGTYRRGHRQWFFAMYVQDNWRVNSRLTLNLGVRWEPYTVPQEVNGLISNMTNIFFPHLAGSIVNCAGKLGCGGSLDTFWRNKSLRDIGPRFGFAYDPFGSGKTSIRGGFGLLYEPNDPNLFFGQMDRNPPLAFDFSITGTGHFPDAFSEIAGQTTLGPAFVVEYWNNKSPHVIQYNMTVQQQLGAADVVSVGFAGSRGMNLLSVLQYNTPQGAFYNGRSLQIPTSAELIAQFGSTQPNTNYSDINYAGPAGDSWYNSLQISYQRRFAAGLQTQVSYTFQKNLSTSDSGTTANQVNVGSTSGRYAWDLRTNKGLSGYDIKNTLNINYSYDLPLARGTRGIAGRLLSGWRTTGVLAMHSGHPGDISIGVPTGTNSLNTIRVPTRHPNTNPNFSGKLILGTPSDCNQCKYFDPSAFIFTNCATGAAGTPTGPGTNGIMTPDCIGLRELGNLGRNTLVGPGSISWNPALAKNIPITEHQTLEFRMEMFNALNRANYSFPAVSLATAAGASLAGPAGTAGRITTTNSSARQIQFALKLIF
jgi:carboxypeptidase family protein